MRHRIHYYNSRMFCDQIHSGDPYGKLQSAISVVITDFNWMDSSAFANHFTYFDPQTHCEFSDIQSIHTLELPKLPDEGEGRLYTWCRFLDAEDEDELRGLAEGEVKTQVTIAHNLKEAGLPFDIIAQSTGLSLDEVAGL